MLGDRDATPRQSFKSCAICSLPRTINICPRYVTAPTDRLLENVWNLNQSFISDVIAAHRDTHANMNLLLFSFLFLLFCRILLLTVSLALAQPKRRYGWKTSNRPNQNSPIYPPRNFQFSSHFFKIVEIVKIFKVFKVE
jgi:hypothetical protein